MSSSLFVFGPRSPPSSTLFPYTTLFRSHLRELAYAGAGRRFVNGIPPEVSTQLDAELALRGHLGRDPVDERSEEHTSELQSRRDLVCRLLLEKKNKHNPS